MMACEIFTKKVATIPFSSIWKKILKQRKDVSEYLPSYIFYIDETDVNIVSVLIGGDYRSLQHIVKRIEAGIPTVICAGSGLAADLLMIGKLVMEKNELT